MRGVLFACFFFCAVQPPAATHAQNAPAVTPREPVLVTISKETTRITEPLKESGYPDFLEAVNLAAKGNLKPHTNGVLLIIQAAGIEKKYVSLPGLSVTQIKELYLRLGIDPLPADAPKLLFSEDFVENLPVEEFPEPNEAERKLEVDERVSEIRTRIHHEFGICSERPWKSTDQPRVARWLKQQQPALAHLDRMAVYPDAYLPAIAGKRDRSLMAAEYPLHDLTRKLHPELNIRAMHALGENRVDAALDDLERMMVLRRYLRNNSNGILTNVTVISLTNMSHGLFNECLCFPDLTAQQLLRIETLLDKYDRPLDSMIDVIDHGERLFFIRYYLQSCGIRNRRQRSKTAKISNAATI